MQTAQGQPITGTPTEVPVPSRMNLPWMSTWEMVADKEASSLVPRLWLGWGGFESRRDSKGEPQVGSGVWFAEHRV